MSLDIDQLLAERGKTHGDYSDHAMITQQLKAVMHNSPNWRAGALHADQMETLEMVAHKIGRMLTGDPSFLDHVDDCIGYFKLTADRMRERRSQAVAANHSATDELLRQYAGRKVEQITDEL